MSVRDVIAKALRDNTRVQMSLHCTDAILSALDKAGYAVVPQTFSTNAVAAIRDTVKPHIKRHDVRWDDGRVKLEIHIDFPEIYKAMLTAAKETP